jgi:hypothetical protein
MIQDLTKTTANIVYTLIKEGRALAPEEIAQKRIQVCESCEFLKKEIYQCDKCKCFMKVKTKLIAAKCPIEKW